MRWGRPWSEPALKEGKFQLMPGDAAKPPRRIAGVKGHWSAADFYVQAPEALLDVTFRIYILAGNFRIVAEYASLHERMSESYSGRIAGLLFSIRGRPCDGFDVEAVVDTQDDPEAITDGIYRLECWGQDGIHGDMAGPQLVQPYAAMPRQVDATHEFTNATAGTPIAAIAASAPDRTVHLASICIGTDDNVTRQFQVFSQRPSMGSVLRLQGHIIDVSSCDISFPMPLRGALGGFWVVNISGLTVGRFSNFNLQCFET